MLMQINLLNGVEPWQAPLLVMAVMVAPISVAWLFHWLRTATKPDDQRRLEVPEDTPSPSPRWISRAGWDRARTISLALLTGLILVFFTQALGPTGADKLATVASAVSAMVGVFLTFQSYLDHRKNENGQKAKDFETANETSRVEMSALERDPTSR